MSIRYIACPETWSKWPTTFRNGGYSGRVVLARANTETLDRQVTLEPDTTYKVRVQHYENRRSGGTDGGGRRRHHDESELILTSSWEKRPGSLIKL